MNYDLERKMKFIAVCDFELYLKKRDCVPEHIKDAITKHEMQEEELQEMYDEFYKGYQELEEEKKQIDTELQKVTEELSVIEDAEKEELERWIASSK